MAESFRIGNIVQLASGGPLMTVEGILMHHDWVGCVWFEGTEPRREAFDPDTLVIYGKDPTDWYPVK